MGYLEKLDKIENYLRKIEQLNQSLKVSGEINRLQSDLVKEYLRDLYELYADLEHEAPVATPSTLVDDPILSAPEEPEAKEEITQEVKEEPTSAEPETSEEEVAVEPIESKAEDLPEPTPKAESEPEDQPISLLEKFQKESTGKEVNRKPVSDKALSDLIPLNEKFMFIMEFFDNSISRYEAALIDMDGMSHRKEVMEYMEKNAWSTEVLESQQELVERFIHIIDRKYPE